MARPCDQALFDQWQGQRNDAQHLWDAMRLMMREPEWAQPNYNPGAHRGHVVYRPHHPDGDVEGWCDETKGETPWR